MENTLVVKMDVRWDALTVRSLRVLKAIQKRLGDTAGYIYYGDIAKELGLTKWNYVKQDVQKLARVGALSIDNGKLQVLKNVVL